MNLKQSETEKQESSNSLECYLVMIFQTPHLKIKWN